MTSRDSSSSGQDGPAPTRISGPATSGRGRLSACALSLAAAVLGSACSSSVDQDTTTTGQADTSLTGYGATRQAWDEEHGPWNPEYAEGAVYGDLVRPDTYEYFSVDPGEPILSYYRGFPEGTDLATAKDIVLRDFPGDAVITIEDRDEPRCLIVLIESETVESATGDNAIAAYFSGPDTDFTEADVVDAVVTSAAGSTTDDLGFC